ncbi:MAG: A/G-specific adenine glycosylase [Bacteroidetes bacterium]|nr:MAG: A/G-specific adenine glycosylase [Bacteroidota bacterium]
MADFHLLTTDWYRQNHRDLPWRNTNDPYKIWLSEVILQQTRVAQGLSYYEKFVRNYPTLESLASAEEQQVLKDWQGLGYYSRARNLHFAAKQIMIEFKGNFPSSFMELKKVKGIGNYTAAAIASFAFKESVAVVDGNVYRVLSRCFDLSTPIDTTAGVKEFQELAQHLIHPAHPDIHNQAIMELGALICTPKNPECNECPINSICLAKQNKTIENRPVKSKKTKVRQRYFHYLIEDSRDLHLTKRSGKDIWQNMFEFPLIESSNEIEFQLKHDELSNLSVYHSEQITHLLSHQKLNVIFYHIPKIREEYDGREVHKIPLERLSEYPVPKIIENYIERIIRQRK